VTLHDGSTRKPRTAVNIEKAAPWCVGSNLERYSGRPLRYPTAARTRVKTGIWYFRQCQMTIRLWHDQHPIWAMSAYALRSGGSSRNSAGKLSSSNHYRVTGSRLTCAHSRDALD
jgi:hypothetical protein